MYPMELLLQLSPTCSLYLLDLENNVLHEERKKNVFLRIMYVHAEYTWQTATFIVCQLLLQSDNCEIMLLLLVVLSRT